MTETTNKIIDAIKKHNLIFVSAQPDSIYFHWQVELYLYQFAKHGPEIASRCYALLGYRGDQPSAGAQQLAAKVKATGAHVFCYKDSRNLSVPNFYIPSIRPHLLKQFFAVHPELGTNVFYHDSDIFLVRLPRFDLLLGDSDKINYVSDTISYIGYDYLKGCADRYQAKHPELRTNDLIQTMCDCVGISAETVKANQAGSGGAQYLLKNVDAAFWIEAETACQTLYSTTANYDRDHKIDSGGLQVWTADMWVVLWLVWKRGSTTQIHKELDFSWATYSVMDYHKYPIFHLAGITGDNCKGKFYKGAYTNRNVITEYLKNKSLFDDIDKNSATYEYVALIKEYAEGLPAPDETKKVTRFLLDSKDPWSGVYSKDAVKGLWRSADGHFIIFSNGSDGWTLTASQYEVEITPTMGGFASCSAEKPYEDGWNHTCTIKVLE
jgi:hypothetical protein